MVAMVTRSDFNRYMMPTYKPAEFVPSKAKGSWVWDNKNKKYIDFASGIAVKIFSSDHVNHCNMIRIEETTENNFLIEISPNYSLRGWSRVIFLGSLAFICLAIGVFFQS